MYRIIAYILTVLLFMGSSVLYSLHFPIEGMNNQYNFFHPNFYILLCTVIPFLYAPNTSLQYKVNKQILILLLVTILICSVFIIIRSFKNIFINSIALPALHALFFANINQSFNKRIRHLLLLMFIANCLLAIGERLFMHNVFPMHVIYKYMVFSPTNPNLFRSTALLGHPLTNALITSIIMSFITISSLKSMYKYGLLLLGFFALICFNARGTIIVSSIFTIILFLSKILNRRESSKSKFIIILFFIFAALMMYFLLVNGFGGRFFENSVEKDGSILARIRVWKLLQGISIKSLLFGIADVKAYTISILNTFHVENWLVLFILQIGLIPTAIFICLYIPIFHFFLGPYTRFQVFFLVGTFICAASTNNSLAAGVPAMSIFFICTRAFKPETSYSVLLKLLRCAYFQQNYYDKKR